MRKITLTVVVLNLIFNIFNLTSLKAEENKMTDQVLINHIEKSILKGHYNSIIIAIIDKEELTLKSFGEMTEGSGTLPDVSTLYEMSSVSKSFLGSLIALMVEKNEIKLSDPINNYLPSGVTLKSYKGKEVTILDLLTHHSGLPTMPSDYITADDINPYKNYTRQDLWNSVNAFNPTKKPGKDWEYSNFAIAILSEALAYKKGKSYYELLQEYILIPLEMNNTFQTLNEDQKRNLAQGHDEDGDKTNNLMDQGALHAAGFMITNISDMIK